jgi:hypothetical protein
MEMEQEAEKRKKEFERLRQEAAQADEKSRLKAEL